MNGQPLLASITQRLDAIEHAERRFAEQASALKQTQQEQGAAIEKRRRSSIEETNRLTASLEKIQHAVLSELKEAGLKNVNPAPAPSTINHQITSNPQLADLSTLLKQVGKQATALESSLRKLEHHRDLQVKAAQAVQALKSQPPPASSPTKPAPPLITPPPTPLPPTPPAKTAWPTALLALGGIAALVLALLLYYLLTK